MAERKPTGVSWESWADALYRQAAQEGAFENLPGAGKPIPDLENTYDENWWLKQWMKRENLSALPETLAFKIELQKEFEKLWRLSTEACVRSHVAEMNAKIRKLNATIIEGPPLDLTEIDVDLIVKRWRERPANCK